MIEPDALVMICPLGRMNCQGRNCMSWLWVDDPTIPKPDGTQPEGECSSPLVNPYALQRAIRIALEESRVMEHG